MKRLLALALLLPSSLALAASAQANFTQELGSPLTVGAEPNGIVSADFNRDGRPDLAVANATSGTISVLLRQAGGGFVQEGAALASGPGTSALAVGDFNRDTWPDLAAANYATVGATGVVFLRNPTTGFLMEGGGAYSINGVVSVAAGDFNGDSRPDIAWGSNLTDAISVYLRSPSTGFVQEGSAITTPGHKVALVSADFNGDGRVDVASANSSASSVTVFQRASSNTGFLVSEPIPAGLRPMGLASGDFNADGRTDLAVSSFESSSVRLLLSQPTGTFSSGGDFATGTAPFGVATADFNGDGALDLAVANYTAGSVSVLLRSGAGFVSDPSAPIPTGQISPNAIVAADFDGDGRPDIAVTNQGSASVTILRNTTPPAAGLPPAAGPPPPAAAAKRLLRKVSLAHKTTASYTQLTKLQVEPVKRGDRIQLSCNGRGCKPSKKSIMVKRDKKSLSLLGFMKGSQLAKGAKVEIRVTQPGAIGAFTRIGIRAPKKPAIASRCLQPGKQKPVSCS